VDDRISNLTARTPRAKRAVVECTETPDGALVKLVVRGGEVVGGVIIRAPCPWVYRKRHLLPSDVD